MHNIRHTNVIAMQDAILIAKVPDGITKKKQLVVDMPNAEAMRVCNAVNILLKYNWHLNPMDNEVAINLEL